MIQIRPVLPLDHIESANAAADVDAGPFFVLLAHLEAGARQRTFGRRDGELNEAPHLLDFFFLDVDALDRIP